MINRARSRSAGFRVTQLLKITQGRITVAAA